MEKILNSKNVGSPFAGRFINCKDRYALIWDFMSSTLFVNGYTIYLQNFNVYDINRDFALAGVYMVKPNNSSHWFVFRTLESARDFCSVYSNRHSNKFWLSRFYEIYLFPAVVRLTVDLLPNVAFSDPDLPF